MVLSRLQAHKDDKKLTSSSELDIDWEYSQGDLTLNYIISIF